MTNSKLYLHALAYVLAAVFTMTTSPSYAQGTDSADNFIHLITPETKNQLWLNPGMASYHFQQDKNFNGGNWGAGAEYRFNSVASVTVGRFYNSDRDYSNYAGVYYQPIAIGPIKLGAVFGGFNGYPGANNGGWFPAVLPALTWEGDWVGANVFVIPTVGDRVHGAISLQLKMKIWESNEEAK